MPTLTVCDLAGPLKARQGQWKLIQGSYARTLCLKISAYTRLRFTEHEQEINDSKLKKRVWERPDTQARDATGK